MTRFLAGCAALALVSVMSLPGSARAAEPSADGARSVGIASTDISSQRRYHRRYVHRHWGPRYGWRHRWHGPRYGWRHRWHGPRYGYWGPRRHYGWGRPWYRHRYAYWGPRYRWGYPYGYYGSRYYYGGPAFGFRLGPIGFAAW